MSAALFFVRLSWHTRAWWRARNLRLFLLGLPALVSGVGLAVLAAVCLLTPAGELDGRYLEAGKSGLEAKDYARALTCYDRLAHRGGDRPEVHYGLALAAEGLGQTGRAAALMGDLARADGPGYAPACLWEARRRLRDPANPAEARAAAESLLLRALDGSLDDRDAAHALLGEVYLAAGRLDQAEPHLTRAVKSRPQSRMRLAYLYALRGSKDRAANEARLAMDYFRACARADLNDHAARVRWADALAFLERFPEAVAVLEEGWNASHESVYQAALAGVYLVWADLLARDPKASLADRLRLVERGLAHDPTHPGLLNRLLAATRTDGADAEAARVALRHMAATGQAPAVAHFALGLDAWQRGRAEDARVHWERAHQLAPQMPSVANNLAWLLAEAKKPDLPRALELANLSLERSPDNPTFRDTRGRILARMGRWKEALPDLEAAVAAAPKDSGVHRALADVYRHLGMTDMADEHQRLAY